MLRRDSDHNYFLGDVRVPGVNEILKSVGLVDTTFMNEAGAERGKRRHKLLEDYAGGQLDWSAVEDEDSHILVGWQEFINDEGFDVRATELPLYHSVLGYAGTADFLLAGETLIVCDVKTGSSTAPWNKVQVALYAMAYADQFETALPRMGVLHLRQAKKRQYSWKPVKEPYILDVAESIVQAYHAQQGSWDVLAKIAEHKVAWIDDLEKELDGQDKSEG